MRIVPLSVALWMAAVVFAEDPKLAALHATLVSLHTHTPEAAPESWGPELTIAKHQLRDWIESRLELFRDDGQKDSFSAQIDEALKGVGIDDRGDEQSFLGSLGGVTFRIESGLLIVTTSVGIPWQYDTSVYGYRRTDGRWRRVWESEQNDYSEGKYTPQHLVEVHVWQPFEGGRAAGPAFVLTLGNDWGCMSTWHMVYYRVWRIESSESKLLIDDSAFAWLRAGTYIVGSIGQHRVKENAPVEVLIEFTQGSIDGGVHNREGVRRFLIEGNQVRRVDPVALSPRDFVDEWMTRDWKEAVGWSASTTLQSWHRQLHTEWVGGEFSDPTKHCQTSDLWQVAVEPSNAAKNFEPERIVYFLVRWRPPYRFTLMNISHKAWPRCTQVDREADEWRTLFSTQEWRR